MAKAELRNKNMNRKEAETIVAEFVTVAKRKGLLETFLLDMDITDKAFREAVQVVVGFKP